MLAEVRRFFRLYRALLDTLIDAFKQTNPLVNAGIRLLFALPNLRPLWYGYGYERRMARDGHVKTGAVYLADAYAKDLLAEGAERVPESGALLVVANHCGMGDALAIYATLPRTDVYTVVFWRGILNGLPNFREFCIVVDPDKPAAALKQMMAVLREGKTVLLFPYGQIEMDPALDLEAALSTLPGWSKSAEFLARKVPGLTVQPVAVGGVISRRGLNLPMVRRLTDQNSRNFLAATFQMTLPFFRDVIVSVAYGEPLRDAMTMADIAASEGAALRRVHEEQRSLVAVGRLRDVG